jgi:hypothetical protein
MGKPDAKVWAVSCCVKSGNDQAPHSGSITGFSAEEAMVRAGVVNVYGPEHGQPALPW